MIEKIRRKDEKRNLYKFIVECTFMSKEEYMRNQIEHHPINTVPLRLSDFIPIKGIKRYEERFDVYDREFDIRYLAKHQMNKIFLIGYNVALGATSIFGLIKGLERILN